MEDALPIAPKRLARDAATLGISALLAQAAGIGSTIVLARVLPLDQFGLFQELLLIYGIGAPLLFGGIPAALTYFLSRSTSNEERSGWAFDATVALAGLGLLFAVLLILLRKPLASVLSEQAELAAAIALLAPYAFFAFLTATTPNALIPTGRARLSALLSAGWAAIYVLCVISAALIAPDVRVLAIAMGISAAISAVMGTIVVGRTIGYRVRWQGLPERVRQFVGYGLPLALTGLAGTLGYQFDRFVVAANFPPEMFAIYAVGAVEIPLAIVVQQSVNSVLLPELAALYRDGDTDGLAALWREAIRKVSIILLPFFILCMIFAEDIVYVAFGPRFSESTEILRIYLLLMPMRVATYGLIPMAIGRTRINLVAAVVVLFSNVVLALALVELVGLPGPAWATVIATALTVGYYLFRLRSLLSLPISALLPWKRLTLTLGVSALAAVPLIPLILIDSPPVLRLVVGGTAYVVLATLALRATRLVSAEDWSRLKGTLSRRRPFGSG
jgi:O-antigen/teichoic acid export membrane protein